MLDCYKLCSDGLEELTINDVKELHYFDRVIKETMRVNPPVPFAGRYLKNDIVMGEIDCVS